MDGELIAGIFMVSLAIAFLVFLFVGIPAIVWFYVINLINITMPEKILIFIFFYLIYLILLGASK